jgi:hypothetical protein
MIRWLFPLLLTCGGLLHADTVFVTVGDTGCVGRQQAVKCQWEKIPGVVSVSVQPRLEGDPGAQRVFVIVSSGSPPTTEVLRTALGRRVKHYPILDYRTASESARPS